MREGDDHRFTRVAAYALVVEDDHMLLCRLSRRAPHPGEWTLPGGGIDFGEAPADAVVREAKEETGLDVHVADVVGIDARVFATRRGTMHGIRIVYRARVIGGTLTNEVDGSTDLAQWWTRADLADLPKVDLVRTFLDRAFI